MSRNLILEIRISKNQQGNFSAYQALAKLILRLPFLNKGTSEGDCSGKPLKCIFLKKFKSMICDLNPDCIFFLSCSIC